MVRVSLIAGLVVATLGSPVGAQSAEKVTSCGHQAEVIRAIQQARLDRVSEREVQAHLQDKATWPENFNTAIPLLTPWVYEMRMRDLRAQDLGAAWTELCLQQ